MKRLSFIFIALLMPFCLFAQKGTIEAYSRENLLSKLDVADAYSFAEFVEGHVYYKDGSMTKSLLNICAYDNSVRFIAGKDTLLLRSASNVNYILTQDNTIVNRDGMMLLLLRQGEAAGLAEKKRLSLKEPTKSGGYGAVPPSSSARTTSADDHNMVESHSYGYLVSIDWSVSYDYYLVKASGDVVRATKAEFLKAFPGHSDMIKSIIKLRKLNLKKREDVLFLYDYCISLGK